MTSAVSFFRVARATRNWRRTAVPVVRTDLPMPRPVDDAGLLKGKVVGVDMTPAMLDKAENARQDAHVANAEFKEGYGENLPVTDGWADVVISNGVFNLMPDKLAALREISRVLKPGGRLQLADTPVQKPVNEKAKERIDLWTG